MIPMLIGGMRTVVLVGALALAGTGCAAVTGEASGSDPAGDGKLQVVTAFYPFQYVAQQVAGDRAEVSSLTAPGAEPHDLELKPSQVAAVSTADLVVYEKTFQSAVDEAVAQSGNQRVLDIATVVPLEPLATENDGHDQGESGLDPHVWLDPTIMVTIANAVRDQLIGVDADHADDYRARAETLTKKLMTIDGEFKTGLADCRGREFITTHSAFGYLAGRYDLEQIGISGISPDAEPSPARIAEVQQIAEQHGITTIFSETLASPAVAEAIAGDLGLRNDVLDPIEGITVQSRGTDYPAVMRANLGALRTANGCS